MATLSADWPPLERLVEPETRYEMIDGKRCYVPPADDSHAERHMQVAVIVGVHLQPSIRACLDMLTRLSKVDDLAPNVSGLPRGLDPATGRRYLDQLSFAIATTQRLTYFAHRRACASHAPCAGISDRRAPPSGPRVAKRA